MTATIKNALGKKRTPIIITKFALFISLGMMMFQLPYPGFQENFFHVNVGETDAQATSRPMLIGMFRGDVNQQAIANLYKTYLADTDLVFSSSGGDQLLVDSTMATVALSGGTLYNLESVVATNSNYHYIIYDLEKAAGPEYDDYVNSTRKAYEAAHGNCYKLILTPAYPDLPTYAKDILSN
jgi:hypothetical protein